MQGALSFSAGTSVRFSPEIFSSDRKVSFMSRKSVISAAFVEAPEMEITSRKSRSLYEVLRVTNDASVREIKAAYRTLAKLYHPDVSAASAAASAAMDFIEIHEAYTTLSDPEAREEYDVALGVRSARSRRRTPSVKYQSAEDYVWAQPGFYSGRRWETDQCW